MYISKTICEMIEITNEKTELFQKLFSIAERQTKFVEIEKIKTVEKLNALKNECRTKIEQLDIRFLTLFNELKVNLKINSFDKIDVKKYPEVKVLKSRVAEISKIVKATQLLEEKNISKLNESKDKLGMKLKGVKQKQKINNAYGHDKYKKMAGSILFDKKW
mgnify:CR=1 FL=1